MDRLFTAFVSSTYLDLVTERQTVANALLNQQCVPLGMEFFPSTGAGQWELIVESLTAADFCVFIIGGRYGSKPTNLDLSWTHREYREAVQRGKPIVVLMHGDPQRLPFDRVEASPEGRAHLEGFRHELQDKHMCRYFTEVSELITGLSNSVAALKEKGLGGWIRAGARPVAVQETDYDRTYELIDISALYSRSSELPKTLDMRYTCRRVIRSNEPDGIRLVAQEFTRESDAGLVFDATNQPSVSIVESKRTGPGAARLLVPRKKFGSGYLQDVELAPPLAADEVVDITLSAVVPSYRYAYREDLMLATAETPLGPRTYDFHARNIAYPTRELRMLVFIPDEVGATPAGPKTGRASTVDHAASAALYTDGSYCERAGELDGVPGCYMELRVRHPRLNRRYRVAWTLPAGPRAAAS